MDYSLKQKINQLFILGFEGPDLGTDFNFLKIIGEGLGGVIFFTQNIQSKNQFKGLISQIKEVSPTPLFLSIDQEGGRVERTENIHQGKKYLSAGEAAIKGEEFLAGQTKEMLKELKDFGINMNFAPVLDVNTNKNNPIIASRAYGDNPQDVVKYSTIVFEKYNDFGIIPVGKHFPGHGDSNVDSHLALPVIDLPFSKLKEEHIQPFEKLIKLGLGAVMVAHVHYRAFDKDEIPASLSGNVIGYLQNTLEFDGLIISDDMVMGGVSGYTRIEAVEKAINAGVDMFIYRHSDNETIELIDQVYKLVESGVISKERINKSFDKIMRFKQQFQL